MRTSRLDTNEIKEWYVSTFRDFESRMNGDRELPLNKIRRDAVSVFQKLGFPDKRMEEWKYTDIQPILKQKFDFPDTAPELSINDIQQFLYEGVTDTILVFVNGYFSKKLSRIPEDDNNGLIISDFDNALSNGQSWIKEHISKYADFTHEPFTALNTALMRKGLFIRVNNDTTVEHPVHLLHIAHPDKQPYQAHPRNLIMIGRNSRINFIRSYHHLSEEPYFHNSVSEIVLEEDATYDEIRIQDESPHSYRIDRTQFYQKDRSTINTVSLDLGGSLVRNNLGFSIDGENCETNLFGFYLLSGDQHVDNHTNIDHLQPNCVSNELYKGILNDSARAVFSGTIYVARDAQKTNAFQSNKNLLLSEKAEIDSKPQLKIFADDVKCSHGATIGQLDEEALFYLRQRGISEADALTLLRSAFAGEIFDKIGLKSVREYIQEKIGRRLRKEFK